MVIIDSGSAGVLTGLDWANIHAEAFRCFKGVPRFRRDSLRVSLHVEGAPWASLKNGGNITANTVANDYDYAPQFAMAA